MSKRFGRNQRRRAREEQSRLMTALEMQQGLARHLANEKMALDDELREAKAFALQFSAAFAPETLALEIPRTNRLELHEPKRFSMEEAVSLTEHAAMVTRLPLRVLLADVESDRFRQAMHCRVRFGDGTWAYGITEQAMVSMPRRRLVETIAKSIAEQIARDVR